MLLLLLSLLLLLWLLLLLVLLFLLVVLLVLLFWCRLLLSLLLVYSVVVVVVVAVVVVVLLRPRTGNAPRTVFLLQTQRCGAGESPISARCVDLATHPLSEAQNGATLPPCRSYEPSVDQEHQAL